MEETKESTSPQWMLNAEEKTFQNNLDYRKKLQLDPLLKQQSLKHILQMEIRNFGIVRNYHDELLPYSDKISRLAAMCAVYSHPKVSLDGNPS